MISQHRLNLKKLKLSMGFVCVVSFMLFSEKFEIKNKILVHYSPNIVFLTFSLSLLRL